MVAGTPTEATRCLEQTILWEIRAWTSETVSVAGFACIEFFDAFKDKTAARHQLEDKAAQSQLDSRKWLVANRLAACPADDKAATSDAKQFDAAGRIAKKSDKKGVKQRT